MKINLTGISLTAVISTAASLLPQCHTFLCSYTAVYSKCLWPCFTSFSSEAQDFQCGASEKKAQITHSRWKGSTTLWKGPTTLWKGPIPTEIGIGPNWPINGWCCSPQPRVNRSCCSRGDLPLSKPYGFTLVWMFLSKTTVKTSKRKLTSKNLKDFLHIN